MKLIPKYLLFALINLLPFHLLAWGVDGHRAIGRIAEQHLSRKAKKEIRKLLGSESLAMVSTWPDEIRPQFQYSYTAPWHYVNAPVGLTYAQFTASIAGMATPNAYNALLQQIQNLKDPAKSKEEKIFALKFIVHLVGDVHQPLHAGHAEDQGGNKIKVTLRNKESNLHSVWDSGIIEGTRLTYSEMAEEYDYADKSQVNKWQKDAISLWLFESYKLSEPIYAEAEKTPAFSNSYILNHRDTIKERVQQAGVRLAGILNKAF